MPRDDSVRRLLHLTNIPSINGRDAFRARALVERFSDEGWNVLVRNCFVENRSETVTANPALELDATDAKEFHSFGPTVVLAEEGLLFPGTQDWRLPARIAVEYVESGGVFLVLDASREKFENKSGLSRETGFFGAHVRDTGPHGVRYLQDETANHGYPSSLMCRPERMLVSEWLRPALDGVDAIRSAIPVALDHIAGGGDIAASAEPTARTLEGDIFTGEPWSTPIATVRQHGLGYAGIIGAVVSPDNLTRYAPGNIKWIVQLSNLLANEAFRLSRLRGSKEPRPRWEGDPRRTVDLLSAAEDQTLEIKQTARYDIR